MRIARTAFTHRVSGGAQASVAWPLFDLRRHAAAGAIAPQQHHVLGQRVTMPVRLSTTSEVGVMTR
jgi:hypothetical protein